MHGSKTIKNLIKTIYCFIADYAVNLTIQWISGHANIPGNERADKLAKQGATRPQTDYPTSIEKQQNKQFTRKRSGWQDGQLRKQEEPSSII